MIALAHGDQLIEVGAPAVMPRVDVVHADLLTGTVHPGITHVACIASIARRWAAVASRRLRPSSRTSPAPPSTNGTISASHASRRTASGVNGTPPDVSQTDASCSPCSSVSRSMSADTSGTR